MVPIPCKNRGLHPIIILNSVIYFLQVFTSKIFIRTETVLRIQPRSAQKRFVLEVVRLTLPWFISPLFTLFSCVSEIVVCTWLFVNFIITVLLLTDHPVTIRTLSIIIFQSQSYTNLSQSHCPKGQWIAKQHLLTIASLTPLSPLPLSVIELTVFTKTIYPQSANCLHTYFPWNHMSH